MKIYSSIASRHIAHSALLVDLECLSYGAGGRLLSAGAVGRRLDRVLALAGPVHHVLVAAQRHMLDRYGAELAARGLRWREVPPGPDSADRELARVGLELVARGFRRVVVASADHYFAPFADVCELCVAVPPGVPVSARLAAAGTVLAHAPAVA